MTLKIEKIDQIGIVVYDINSKIDELEKLGLGPFTRIELRDQPVIYRGRKRKIKMKIAMAHIGNIQLELIEAEGECFYTDFIKEYGEGLNHLGIYVQDINEELKKYRESEIEILQEGEIYGVKWVYLDTSSLIGFVLELIEVP